MPDYHLSIIVDGEERASGLLGNVAGGLGRIAEFAVGGLLVRGIEAIGRAIGSMASSALEAVGHVQILERQVGGLIAESLMYQKQADGTYKKTMDFGEATELAAGQTAGLLAFIEKLAIQSPFEINQIEEVARIGLAAKLSADQVDDFTAAFMDYAAVHGISSERLAFAADQFLQLKKVGALTEIDLRQLRRLGIDLDRIIGTDMSDSLAEATSRFGDLSPAARKVFEGLPVGSVKDFNALLKENPEMMDAIFQKFILISEEGAGGAAKAMATTVTGMMSNFRDVIEVGSRKLFRPIVEAASPFISEILGQLTQLVTGGQLEQWGARAGAFITTTIVPALREVWNWLQVNLPIAIGTLKAFWAGVLLPAIQAAGAWIQTNLVPVLMTLWSWLQQLLPLAIQVLSDYWTTYLQPIWASLAEQWTTTVQPALAALWAWLQERVPQAIAALGAAWEAYGKPFLATVGQWIADVVIPALAQLAAWLMTNLPVAIDWLAQTWTNVLWPAILAVWGWIQTTLIPMLTQVWNWLQVNLPIALQVLSDFWNTVLLPAIQAVWTWITTTLLPLLQTLWDWLQTNLPIAIETLKTFWTETLLPAITAVWAFVNDYLVPLWNALVDLFNNALTLAITALTGLWEKTLQPALAAVWTFIDEKLLPVLQAIADKISITVQPILEAFSKFLNETLAKAFDGIKSAISGVTEFVQTLADKIASVKLPDWCNPGSPTPLELGLRGIGKALREVSNAALPELQARWNAQEEPLTGNYGMRGNTYQYNLSMPVAVTNENPAEAMARQVRLMRMMTAGG